MPSCQKCSMRSGNECTAHTRALNVLGRELPPPPVGACALPLVEGYLSLIKQGNKVLEIGCGTWSPLKDHCNKVGAHYEGIDTQSEYYGKAVVATRVENLADLSFPDDEFDFVIGNQTMEHWAEYGCPIRWGLYHCFRVCKPGGSVFMNVPIYFHGTEDFVHGKLEKIRSYFAKHSKTITFEEWGNPSAPIPSFYAHPSFWSLKKSPGYVLDVRAIKNLPLGKKPQRLGFIPLRLYRFMNYSFSYLLYRAAKRFGILPKGSEFKVYQPNK